MQLWKFSLLLLCLNVYSFDLDECLNTNFAISITHGGAPLGLIPRTIQVEKSACVLGFSSTSYFVLKEEWTVDVCRTPVHIKKGSEVLKKQGMCTQASGEDAFCMEVRKLLEEVQDNALVFANGEKEIISSDHGKSYCAYELLLNYLNQSKVYSRYNEPKTEEVKEVVEESPTPTVVPTEQATEQPQDQERPKVEATSPPDKKQAKGSSFSVDF